MDEARKLIAELIDPDACQYDHNNLCQAHSYRLLNKQEAEDMPYDLVVE